MPSCSKVDVVCFSQDKTKLRRRVSFGLRIWKDASAGSSLPGEEGGR